jgi:hypothetical protein
MNKLDQKLATQADELKYAKEKISRQKESLDE